jgi:acetyl esterase
MNGLSGYEKGDSPAMTERAYDPELAASIPILPTTMDWNDVAGMRKQMDDMIAAMAPPPPPDTHVRYEDQLIPGPDGAPDVSVRVYRPSPTAEVRPGVLYLHGGGFMVGSVEGEHLSSLAMAEKADAVVVSVEYRLAPEHPYPAGLDDCYAALVWMTSECRTLGIDPDHIGVMGQSAGGGLSAALALLARDRNGPKLCFQLLGIPELDDRLETTSMREFTDTPLWNRPNAEVSWRFYLGDGYGKDVPAYAAPARASDLSGLPPAYISTMEFDPLRDEGILYALHLLEQGVPVELHQYPGTFHGSHLFGNADVSKRTIKEMTDALRRGLRR